MCPYGDLRRWKNLYDNRYVHIAEDWALVVVKKYEQNRLIKEMHEGPGGGHFGVSRIQNKLCEKYFWPTMVEDVKYYVKTCKKCQQINRSSLLKPKLSLKLIPVPSKIFAQIGMDLIHMNRCRGYNYIITAVDYLSKYCEMRRRKVQKKLEGSYMKI